MNHAPAILAHPGADEAVRSGAPFIAGNPASAQPREPAPRSAPLATELAAGAIDRRFMRDAIMLGHRHLGITWPNPSVGAVVVRETADGPVVVGRGNTQAGGRPHAETQALNAAGAAARGATLYVSLEPCSHHGKTPPCAEAAIASGIARVVTAMDDPDPRVSGRGHAMLEAAGIAVTRCVLAEEARRSHLGHVMRVTQGRPALFLKLARTADGFAGRRGGPRLLITSDAANARMHLERARADAICVGIGTVLADDPKLTARLPGLEERSPVRVILDSHLRTPVDAYLVATARDVPTWIVAAETAPVAPERVLTDAGVEVMRVGAEADGRLDLVEAMRLLASRGITRVFSEGGPSLAEAYAKADLIDELTVTTAPVVLGEAGVPAIGPTVAALMQDALLKPDAARARARPPVIAGPDRMQTFERCW